MYQTWSILFLFLITTVIFNVNVTNGSFYICMTGVIYGFDSKTCIYKNIYTNKTHFDFTPMRLQEQTKIIVKNSTIQKMGKVGFCTLEFRYTDVKGDSIKELDLTNSHIEEIHPDAFSECTTIKTLILRDNKLELLEKNLLNRNEKLEIIDLSNNLIKDLESGTFDNLGNLKKLVLSGNKLKMFRVNLIESCSNLEILRLDSNDLFDLDSKRILEYVPKLERIFFNNNQLRCERVPELLEKFKFIVVDDAYEGDVRKRIEPTKMTNSTICLEDIPWAASHYIFMYTKIINL